MKANGNIGWLVNTLVGRFTDSVVQIRGVNTTSVIRVGLSVFVKNQNQRCCVIMEKTGEMSADGISVRKVMHTPTGKNLSKRVVVIGENRVGKNMSEKLALKHSVQLAEIERKLTGFEKRLDALEKANGRLSKKRLTEIANEFERLISK